MDPWFASSRETQLFFWLLWHTAIFDERGILKERDSKGPAAAHAFRRGSRNAWARGRLLTKQEKSINKQAKIK